MNKVRSIVALVVAAFLVIVIFQNTEVVETRLLFATVAMPRALLLLSTLAVGFTLGALTTLVWTRKQDKPKSSP